MLLEAANLSKTIGSKDLFHDLSFIIEEGEKVALIGRNGQGKTTILKILDGEDEDFGGEIRARKNLRVTLTKQEHIADTQQTALDYILKSVPDYHKHEKVLQDFEAERNTDIHQYSHALEQFSVQGYFQIQELILNTLADFQIPRDRAIEPLQTLSGGEKRYVELTRMMFSRADLFLVDEPTNHMDYLGKEKFIAWLNSTPKSVVVVTHDRDVLKHVDKIIELKDKKLSVFKGNYDQYLSQNAMLTTDSVKQYSDQLNRLKEAKERVDWGLRMRAKSKAWTTRYEHWLRDYEKIKAETIKPSFWIDQTSVESLDKKVLESYHKFKEKNITLTSHTSKERIEDLIAVKDLSLGYATPLFSGIRFELKHNDRVFIKGRNGAGKSTLVRTIISLSKGKKPKATVFAGEIVLGNKLRIGEYEQEISEKYLDLTLERAVHLSYSELDVPADDKLVKGLLAQYLFDPLVDGRQKIANLSGGQKARFQLIKMFVNKPNLLILDEPTNHLDLPSIEELEKSLSEFQGGILYISHDTYFIEHMGGKVVEI
ncbi:MAG TPA: ABC-F family ATP-binding cassette domain-containing protein [Candidatus Saccharimonadia bacterium]|nr:ABC-F family ATP-binding cassette domain-containing protein [Candidatus Saccharimonadia bacterium]